MSTDTFEIGPGVRQAMRDAGDEPRSHEQYFHDHTTNAVLYSITQGRDAEYRWTPQDGVRRLPFGDGEAAPVQPAPLPAACWDRTQLITAGFNPGRPGPITAVVWHDMEGYLAGAISRWNTGAAGAHLCILRTGEVVRTCRLEDTAWHAGTSNDPLGGVYGRTPFWRSHNINGYSVGIELEGFAASGFTAAQASACRRVADWLTAKYAIPRWHTFDQIAGHHSHGELSTSRSDPGPTWNWNWVL